MNYSPQGHKESDTTEVTSHAHIIYIHTYTHTHRGEGVWESTKPWNVNIWELWVKGIWNTLYIFVALILKLFQNIRFGKK